MTLKCIITQATKGVEIFQLENGKYWPVKFTNYAAKVITSRNSPDFSGLKKAINHSSKFINQRPRAPKN